MESIELSYEFYSNTEISLVLIKLNLHSFSEF